MELGLWGRDLFGSLALELSNLGGGFDMLEFVFDMQGKVFDSSLYISAAGSDILVRGRDLISLGVI